MSATVTIDETTNNVTVTVTDGQVGPQGPTGATGATGATGPQGQQGPAGPAPSGTGLVSVTSGVLDTPSTLSDRVAADAANLRDQLQLDDNYLSLSGGQMAGAITFANGSLFSDSAITLSGAQSDILIEGTSTLITVSSPNAIFSMSGESSEVRLFGLLKFSFGSFSTVLGTTKTATQDRFIEFPDADGYLMLKEENLSGLSSNYAARQNISAAKLIETKSANFTAEVGGRYQTTAAATVTDPTTRPDSSALQNGDSFEIWIGGGNATIGGTAYAPSRFPIRRVRLSGAWTTPTPVLSDALDIASGARATTRTNLGAGATGDSLFTAATAAAANTILGTVSKSKAATQSKTSDTSFTATPDTHLVSYTLAANTAYRCEINGAYKCGAGGIKFQLAVPSLAYASGNALALTYFAGTTAVITVTSATAITVASRASAVSPAGTTGSLTAIFEFLTGSSGGDASLQWAQNSSSIEASELMIYSAMSITKVTP